MTANLNKDLTNVRPGLVVMWSRVGDQQERFLYNLDVVAISNIIFSYRI